MANLYRCSDVAPARDFVPEPLVGALRRCRLRSHRAVFTRLAAGSPPRHIASWTGRDLVPGRDATTIERAVIAALAAEPVPASAETGVVVIIAA
jgi:hypothetical protein